MLFAISMPTSLPFKLPTSLPVNVQEPFTQRILLAAGGFILLIILLRVLGRMRQNSAARRRAAELRRGFDAARTQQEEVHRLAEQILATSSTSRIAGYAILRQIETVVTEARASSVAALDQLKAFAAQKGANGIINVETRQMPNGKWVASGDAVLLKMIGRPRPTPDSK